MHFKNVGLSVFPLPVGFVLEDEKVVYLTSKELFGFRRHESTYSSKFRQGVVLNSYTDFEKTNIAFSHLIAKQSEANGLKDGQISFDTNINSSVFFAFGNKIYVANGTNGYSVYQIDGEEKTATHISQFAMSGNGLDKLSTPSAVIFDGNKYFAMFFSCLNLNNRIFMTKFNCIINKVV